MMTPYTDEDWDEMNKVSQGGLQTHLNAIREGLTWSDLKQKNQWEILHQDIFYKVHAIITGPIKDMPLLINEYQSPNSTDPYHPGLHAIVVWRLKQSI